MKKSTGICLTFPPEDRGMAIQDLKPSYERRTFTVWYESRNYFQQYRAEDTWIPFGFCVCRNLDEIRDLVVLYSELTRKCTFEEFWRAHHDRNLIELMDKYGFQEEWKILRNLQSVLDSSKLYPWAWELKAFT